MNNIFILDNFFENPDEIREQLSKIEYSNSKILPGRKPAYPGTNSKEDLPENIEKLMIEKLGKLTRARKIWKGNMPSISRIAFENEESDITVHTDRAYKLDFENGKVLNNPYVQWTVLVYMTPDDYCKGGLSFQKNEQLNLTHFPLNHEATEDMSYIYGMYQQMLMPDYLNANSDNWTTIKKVDMKYNRGVIFPAHYFHSIFGPQGFGNSFENCRLINIGWFYTK